MFLHVTNEKSASTNPFRSFMIFQLLHHESSVMEKLVVVGEIKCRFSICSFQAVKLLLSPFLCISRHKKCLKSEKIEQYTFSILVNKMSFKANLMLLYNFVIYCFTVSHLVFKTRTISRNLPCK